MKSRKEPIYKIYVDEKKYHDIQSDWRLVSKHLYEDSAIKRMEKMQELYPHLIIKIEKTFN